MIVYDWSWPTFEVAYLASYLLGMRSMDMKE